MSRDPVEQIARNAEKLLSAFVPSVACIPQEWDSRIDCIITLDDGSMAGEMISLSEISEERLRATGDRLQALSEGRDVPLVGEIRGPTKILPRG